MTLMRCLEVYNASKGSMFDLLGSSYKVACLGIVWIKWFEFIYVGMWVHYICGGNPLSGMCHFENSLKGISGQLIYELYD